MSRADEFEITDISARFVSLDVGLVDHAIENALQRLGEFLGVMWGSVTQLDDGGRLNVRTDPRSHTTWR